MARFESKGEDLFIDGKKVIKAWESFTGWYWFAVEKVEERKVSEGSGSIIDGKAVDDIIYYGLVQGMENEWGDFSFAEIEKMIKKGTVWPIPKKNWPWSGRRNNGSQE